MGSGKNAWYSEVCGKRKLGGERRGKDGLKRQVSEAGGRKTERKVSRAAEWREWVVLIGQQE